MIDLQPQIILDNLPRLLEGLWLTLELTFVALAVGLLLALPLARLRVARQPWVSQPVHAFTYFFRGTPMLIQLLVLYYGLAQFAWVRQSFAWEYLREPYWCALLAFTLNTAAYTTEIIAGAIRNIPLGEIEAARAYGMSGLTQFRRIILPSAMRRALPAYSNEVILLLQGTSIASAVTLVDLTGVGRNLYAEYYAPFEAFLCVGLIYLLLTFLLVGLFKLLEQHYLACFAPRSGH